MSGTKKILGIGSALGDDCAGWLLVRALRDDVADAHLAAWQIYELDRPGLALLGWFEDADEVVIVDAMAGGAPPGALRELQLGDLTPLSRMSSSHGFGVAETLQLAGALDVLPPMLRVFGLEVNCADQGAAPSPALLAAVPYAARCLVQALREVTQ